jgi:type I restriction enzyme, S subunit
MTDVVRSAAENPNALITANAFSVSSHWIYNDDYRLDAGPYSAGAFRALDAIEACSLFKAELGSVCGTIWHPVQNQARSNFKRIYTDAEHGRAFLGSREMFFFPLRAEKFLSFTIPKLNDLTVPQGWVLISRSGTVGNVLYVNRRLAQCAITEHAIRIEPLRVPPGYLYAFLASRYGQPLMLKSSFGSVVAEIEPKHLAALPLPIADESVQKAIHNKIVRAYALCDKANDLLDQADERLHRALGVERFSEEDVEYLGSAQQPKAFVISSRELGVRFDATRHVPVARSAVVKLSHGRYPLVPLGELADEIYVAPRFARIYVDKEHGTPLLQGSHVPMMRIHDLKYISNTQTERMERWIIHKGQVLVTCSGTLGRVALTSSAQQGWAASQHILRVTARPGRSHPGFLAAFLMTAYGRHQLLSKSYGGVVDELTEDDTAAVIAPKMPFSAQKDIGIYVEEAYELRDEANRIEDEAISDFEKLLAT